MMGNRLGLFELIDDTTWKLLDNKLEYADLASKIVMLISPMVYKKNKHVVGIKSRVKSVDSLKEKIIRRELYKKYKTADEILDNLSDLLGIMIECKFEDDEKDIYAVLKECFDIKTESGLYTSKETTEIALNLDMPQPQKQKNGHSVYRVDGIYISEDVKVNFEVQIKSLVNNFWSEVEHQVIYKNNHYIPGNDIIKDLLFTLKDNLSGIDKMLHLISNEIENKEKSTAQHIGMEYSSFLAIFISDCFTKKMKESIGFTVDFKKTCEILGVYIMERVGERQKASMDGVVIKLMEQFGDIKMAEVNFEEEITFETKYIAEDEFSQIVGDKILTIINQDFEWHLFFKMLFEIEPGNNIEDFMCFMRVLRDRMADDTIYEPLYYKFGQENGHKMKMDILSALATGFARNGKIEMIYQDTLSKIRNQVTMYVLELTTTINSYDEWRSNLEYDAIEGKYFEIEI